MAYLPDHRGPRREKLIHSTPCFLFVPVGLCLFAVAIRWVMLLF